MRQRASLSILLCVILGVILVAQPASRDVRERAWRANNLGVAYLEQFNYEQAARQFEAALAIDATLTPARVNLAIAHFYAPDLPAALKEATAAAAAGGRLGEASLPTPHVDFVLGLIARNENREADAVAAFRRVLSADPDDVATLVNLGQVLLQQRTYGAAVPTFARAVELEPYNVSALYNLAVAQTRAGDRETGAATMARFQTLRESGYGTTYSNTYLDQGRYAEAILSTGAEPELVSRDAPTLKYSASDFWSVVGQPARSASAPYRGETARSTSAPATADASPRRPSSRSENAPDLDEVRGFGAGDLDRDGRTDLVAVLPQSIELFAAPADPDPRTPTADSRRPTPPTIPLPASFDGRGVVIADIDNDGAADLVVHGRSGVAVLRQTGAWVFSDVTASAGLETSMDVRTTALVDLDHDGDLDIVIGGATRDGTAAPLAVWRNNGDGTFADISATALPGQTPLVARQIVPSDVDLRRDIDLLVLGDDGAVRLWRNMRDGTFRDVSQAVGLSGLTPASAMAVGDVTKDGFPDILLSAKTGPGLLAAGTSSNRFVTREIGALPAGAVAAQLADVDNDGLLDLVALTADGVRVIRQAGAEWVDITAASGIADRGSRIADGRTSPTATPAPRETDASARSAGVGAGLVRRSDSLPPEARSLTLLDASGDGVMDVLTTGAGGPRLLTASGVKSRAVRVTLTAQVSNRSAAGAKVEMRAGSLWQKLETAAASPAAAPADLLFGLGTRAAADVIRVLWPAGIVQAEPIDAARSAALRVEITELDRKPSSCPYLYTWNGARFEFITDFLGGGEMGYQVAPGVYATPDPEEFVRIRGDQLRVRDGRYELRVTNELEETLFLDHLSLVAVDHTRHVHVYPHEGLVSPPLRTFSIQALHDLRPAVRVLDANGADSTAGAARVDRQFVDGLPLLPIRGYAKPHAMTVDLGPDTPAEGAVLLLTGWTDYAFSSDNVAASQAGHVLQPPSLQVRDTNGQWRTIIEEIGVPVGRPQTIVVDLSGRFLSESREVRIATSMRVYWDQVQVAARALDETPVATRVQPVRADLAWRGFSAEATQEAPWTFDYARVTPHSPWKQMPGRYTREGDVRELLAAVDDAFVIARPGDEIAVAFDAAGLPSLRQGWTRTFLLHSDGFSKEMDLNSASPDHAWPLPTHELTSSDASARRPYPTHSSPAGLGRDRSPSGPTPTDAWAIGALGEHALPEPAWFTRYNTRVVARQVPRLAAIAP